MSNNLRAMNLRRANMAMTMVKFRDNKLRIAAAGTPPLLLYRAATGTVEEILLEGMPLGSSSLFKYQSQHEFDLASGDTMVLMSDGLPERLNEAEEELGYPRTQALFASIATKAPAEICEGLARGGDEWARGKSQGDDVTFVVIKVK